MGSLTLPTSGFVTNDVGFRSIAGLPLVILDDLPKS